MEAVRGNGTLEVDGWEGDHAQAVPEAVYESATSGRLVTIAEHGRGERSWRIV